MKTRYLAIVLLIVALIFGSIVFAENDFPDQAKELPNKFQNKNHPNPQKVAAGLKEALEVGVQNAVNLTGRVDGYFANQAIKILVPPKMRDAAKVLRDLGQGAQVDEFVLTMNRAAEHAAPAAKNIFRDAIKQMTIQDALKILNGGDTAATGYFKDKTCRKLAVAFKPQVTRAMDEVGVTRSYKELTAKIKSYPLVHVEMVDIDEYVVSKALDGLFYMVGQEERKIRKDPAARITELLREVFGGK